MGKKAFFMALFTVVIWASSFAGVRASLLGGYTSGHLVLVRFLIASSVFVLYSLLPGVHFKLPSKGDIVRIMLLGWMGITVYHVGLTFGVESIPAGTASMIVGSAPVFTAIIAVFHLKERLSASSWAGLGIGFIGIILITLGSSGGTSFSISKGTIFVLIATIASSIFFVFQKPLYTRYKPIELTAYFTWAGTVPLIIFLPGLYENMKHATTEAHVAAIFVGIFPAALGYATWAIAISLGNPSTVTSMLYMEPAIAIIIAWFWLGEWPNTLSLIGGMIAISSVFIVNFMGRKQRRRKERIT
ncbi:DMT family transporter [Oceanobacillus halophilus]|uniref:DMT family transporter n=1 Tax=Oceanobacillus halophilus TaxID=930130 RepID=A0A495A1P6_9BACI|nr:DMT family transporter [Oceanobacillus halophilus]RKQ33274.1 DMT family transporter [Oceanobacillus halophilus]